MIHAFLQTLPWLLGALRGADSSTHADLARAIYLGQWLAETTEWPVDDLLFAGLGLFARANGVEVSEGPTPASKTAAFLEALSLLREHLPAALLDRVLDKAGFTTLEATLEEAAP